MDVTTQMEFVVDLTCENCATSVEESLKDVKVISFDVEKQKVVVESSLPSQKIQEMIESTGNRAALMGQGPVVSSQHFGAAVAEITGQMVNGVVRIIQLDKDSCLFEGTIDGLAPGEHGVNIHEFGDLSRGCESCGGHFNPHDNKHGGRLNAERHLGDLGNIVARDNGRSNFRFIDDKIKVWDMIGRSMVIHEKFDDLGSGVNQQSKIDGNSGRGIACAIVARSAGLFENMKRICACDGVSVWDERNVPIVGKERARQKL